MSAAPTTAPATPYGQAAEHLKVKLRPDLVVQPQFYEGMTHYVIKDPLALKYFRFKIEEYFLLQQFDGEKNLQDVKRAFERKYRPQTISIEDLVRFVAQLHEAGVVIIDSPEQAVALIRRRRKNRWRKVWGFLANILFIKIPVIDPERLLTWMYPYFRWLFTRTFVAFSTSMMLAAIILVVSQWSHFYSKLPEFQSFFNWWTIFTFWISLAIIKIIHEFGHGLTAKHFGGEVHEMGMLFLVLTPALYCDVTDSWLLPNKWHRIWISAAGIYVELFLASIATFVWFNTEQGLFNSLAMATMFICSVNTVLFNANPLLRYDGYYVTADYLEIPNLRIKSTQFFTYLIQEKVLGLEVPVQSYLPRSRRTLFVSYAIASYLYRWVVTFSIIFFLSQVLKPYKLQSLSYMLALGSLIPLLAMPIYQIGKFVRTPGRMRKVKKARAAAFAAAFVAVVAGILLIPTPLRIQGTLVLSPANPVEVYAEVEGQLVDLKVLDGQWVKKGAVLAQLVNLEKQKERVQRQAEHDTYWFKALWYNQSAATRAQAKQHEVMAEQLEPSMTRINDQLGKLTLTASRDGQLIGVPHRETLGQWLKTGKPFCQLADPHHLEARLIIDQSDIDLIKPDNKTWVKIHGRSETTLVSKVTEIAKRNRDEIPPELANSAGGEIAAKPDPKTGQVKPQTAVYEVIIPIENPNLLFHPGQRGFAKIDGGTHTFGWWLWRLITKTFHFNI
ncbi:HlyD family efflux transporter periplasmic adaptor subunit [Paludisphaera borealis]|uniref:Peptide zinc metalloprotease protein YydH n=1 Tax=Paludisphaera borealis TaxID=1387353 RepID=A0A1U7CKB9_9BACT|nr:HlyD family efflux transporter periplasmic adaptor subunit [Paludisphaera borealis]APW59357.1 Putative peptide zinc metalloprotease protein YydH [Paludisphaera borealis]MDR3618844.1 HlyD family efflux transporter periplasmic adaptor subunit [Paludisphaera borealis]